MFTIKLYAENGTRNEIFEAESFIIHRNEGGSAEIIAPKPEYRRFLVADSTHPVSASVMSYDKAIIENAAGKTTEIVCPVQPLNKAA